MDCIAEHEHFMSVSWPPVTLLAFLQIHQAKTMLELIQDAHAAVAKVEGLVAELPAQQQATEARACLQIAKHAERTASELSRLQFYLTKGAELPLVAALKPRAEAAAAQIAATLRALLAVTLPLQSSEANDATRRCLHSCSLISDIALAHDAIRTTLVQPALERAAAESISKDGALASTPPLPPFLDSVRSQLQTLLQRLNGMIADRPELAPALDVLGECVLAEVHSAVKRKVSGAFSPAVPATFHASYTAAMAFLQWLESQAQARAALDLLRKGAPRAAFLKDWPLAVYFSLVFQELAGSFDHALQAGPQAAAASKYQRFTYSQSQELCSALARCRDPDVTFPKVYERFFKLQLQLVLRYAAWLQEVADARQARQRAAAAQDSNAAGVAGSAAAADFGGFDTGGMKGWAKAAKVQQLVQVLGEVCTVTRVLRDEESAAVAQHLSGAADEAAVQRVTEVCIPSYFVS